MDPNDLRVPALLLKRILATLQQFQKKVMRSLLGWVMALA